MLSRKSNFILTVMEVSRAEQRKILPNRHQEGCSIILDIPTAFKQSSLPEGAQGVGE